MKDRVDAALAERAQLLVTAPRISERLAESVHDLTPVLLRLAA